MLAVVAAALAAADIVQRAPIFPNPFALFWASVAILMAAGTAEYAFEKRWLPLRLWRLAAPIYAFYIASQLGRIFDPDYPVVISVCGMAFLVATAVAFARRANYLGPNRIPLGGRKPSLT